MFQPNWTFGALVCAAGFAATTAFADQGTLTVKATITASCKIANIPEMAFDLDPTSTLAGTAQSGVTYRCTNGISAPTVTVGGVAVGTTTFNSGAANALTGPGGAKIPFSISWTNPTAAAKGLNAATAELVTLNGSILNADYVNAVAGSYSGSVQVSVQP
jgi:spore coat protein U-like protein